MNVDGLGPEAMMPFGLIGGLAWLLIAVGAVLLVIWAVRAYPRSAGAQLQPAAVESPLDILERRFALGELSADEFEKARALLRGESSTP